MDSDNLNRMNVRVRGMACMNTCVTPTVAGVRVWPLEMHPDERGHLTELFRAEWDTGLAPVQWTVLLNVAKSLRGMDIHVWHDDCQVLVEGRAVLGLKDLRRDSPTKGRAELIEMAADDLRAIVVPQGVAHGFYFFERSILMVGSTSYYDPEDHLPCHYADPELGIQWPAEPKVISELDQNAPSLAWLTARIEPRQPL
jgi:dTDP-4-dehydrorhamnose 3,5-epimerase